MLSCCSFLVILGVGWFYEFVVCFLGDCLLGALGLFGTSFLGIKQILVCWFVFCSLLLAGEPC